MERLAHVSLDAYVYLCRQLQVGYFACFESCSFGIAWAVLAIVLILNLAFTELHEIVGIGAGGLLIVGKEPGAPLVINTLSSTWRCIRVHNCLNIF